MIAASLAPKFYSLGFVVGNCCPASSDSCVIALPSEGNFPLYWPTPALQALQVSSVCEGRSDTYSAWHVEEPAEAATYEAGDSSLAVVDEGKCLAATNMVNCCCSTHLNGIEKCP